MAGVMSALAAKNPGNSVLIIEPSNVLGGQGTAGGVAGFCGDTENTNEVFRELVNTLHRQGLISDYDPTADRRPYELEWCAFFLQEMVRKAEIEILLHARVIAAQADRGVVTSLTVSTVGGTYSLEPQVVIDASGGGFVCRSVGFPVFHDGTNKQLPMSLYFTLWDTGKAVNPFLPEGCVEWKNDDEIPMTSLHIFDTGKVEVKMKVVGFDSADGLSYSAAEIQGRRQMMSLIYYLQTVGYRGEKLDRHVLASVSRNIGIRETSRIVGEHVVTEDEVLHGTVFPDAVAVSTYHLDFHWPDRMQRAGTGITTMVEPYHLPLGCMIPKGAKNLLVPGRGASAEQMAMSSFRVMAIVSQMGFAAGKAAQLCVEQNRRVPDLDIETLQRRIERGGQSLDLSDYGNYLRNALEIKEFVFEGPQPFAQCHASTVVQLRNSRFLVAWFGGQAEGENDVGIWLTERFRSRWSEPRLVAKVNNQPHWNPALFRSKDGVAHLVFKVGTTIPDWRSWEIVSGDEGQTWSEPRELAPGEDRTPGPVRCKPIELSDGSWLAGNSIETSDRWDVFVDRSVDGGATWTHSPLIEFARDKSHPDAAEGRKQWGAAPVGDGAFAGKGVIQPTLWESEPGRVHLLARSTAGAIYRSDSEDGGTTWCSLYRTDLPNNNSGIDVTRLDDGALALVYNPVAESWGSRSPLRVSLSLDNGATWPHSRDLEEEDGEFSYPAIIPTRKGMAISYTWKRERIAFWHLSIEHLLDHEALRKHKDLLHGGIMA